MGGFSIQTIKTNLKVENLIFPLITPSAPRVYFNFEVHKEHLERKYIATIKKRNFIN